LFLSATIYYFFVNLIDIACPTARIPNCEKAYKEIYFKMWPLFIAFFVVLYIPIGYLVYKLLKK
jgi:hypothetical protein